ncbi:MAG: electron transport complex subunit RsxE [Patescibacteria group bacterium]
MKFLRALTNGIVTENPTFRLVLGTCPTMAITLAVTNGIGMGIAATAVLIGSNVIVSLIRKVIPDQIRIPCFIVVIAAFVTIVDKMMNAFTPALHQVLGIFIPLIVVNCIIIARAEAYAYKNSVGLSFADGLGMGIGFTAAITLISAIREILGNGSFLGMTFIPEQYTAKVMIIPPGGFFTYGLLLGFVNWFPGWFLRVFVGKDEAVTGKEAAADG